MHLRRRARTARRAVIAARGRAGQNRPVQPSAAASKDRCLFLADGAGSGRPGARPELRPEDVEHALRVLRLEAGDGFVALDGRGSAWPARVVAVRRRELEFVLDGALERAPEPGSSPRTPELCVCVAWPRPGPAEEMLDRLTQLGATRIVPLIAARSGPQVRERGAARRERLERILREALKQCGRRWLPTLAEPVTVEAGRTLARGAWLLDPRAEGRLIDLAREPRASETVWIGPEGGWTAEELEFLIQAGALPCRLADAVLRVETAAEAALAVLAALRC